MRQDLDVKGAVTKEKAPLLGSARLTLFVILLLATCNFVQQRFNVNFGIVCMHRPILQSIESGTEDDFIISKELLINGTQQNLIQGNLSINEEPLVLKVERSTSSENGHHDFRNNNETSISSEAVHKEDAPDNSFVAEFDWTNDTKGSILAAFYYGLTISQIPGGWIVDRFGAKSAILTSQFFLSALTMLNPYSAALGSRYLFFVRLLGGVANGAAMPAINVLATRWCADMERSFLLGITYAGFGLATVIVYPTSAFFCENMGWEWIFYFAGGTGLLWCVVAFFMVFEWPENHPGIKMAELEFIQCHRAVEYGGAKRQVIQTPWVEMLTSLPVWAMLIANFSCFWCFLTISAYLPTYLTQVLNLDISDNGLLSALPFIGMMSFHFFAAALFDWLRKKKDVFSLTFLRKLFNSVGMFSSAISIALLGVLPSDSIIGSVILFTLCQTFIEFAFMGGYLFSIFEIAPRYSSSLTALSNTFGLLAGFLSPAVASYLTPDGTQEQWLLVFYVCAAVNVFGAVFYLLFGKCTLLSWAADVPKTVVDGDSGITGNTVSTFQE